MFLAEAAENVTNTERPSRNLLGDGVCDDDLNTELNGYDLGDCCEETSSRDLCQECRCPAEVIYKPHGKLDQLLITSLQINISFQTTVRALDVGVEWHSTLLETENVTLVEKPGVFTTKSSS